MSTFYTCPRCKRGFEGQKGYPDLYGLKLCSAPCQAIWLTLPQAQSVGPTLPALPIFACLRQGCSWCSSDVPGVWVTGSPWGIWACSQGCADRVLLLPRPIEAIADMQDTQGVSPYYQVGDPERLEDPYKQMG